MPQVGSLAGPAGGGGGGIGGSGGGRKPGPWARPTAFNQSLIAPGDYIFAFNEAAGALTRGGFYGLAQVGNFAALGSPKWASGLFGGPALSFDGASGYVDAGTGFANFQTTSAFSVLAWIKCNTNSAQMIVTKWAVLGSPGWQFHLDTGGVLGALFTGASGGTPDIFADTAVAMGDNKWHQVVWTYDGSQTAAGMTFYIDGQPVASTNQGNDTSPGTLGDSDLLIGARLRSGVAERYFSGLIDHVVIHAGKWTRAQVQELYLRPFAPFARAAQQPAFTPTAGGVLFRKTLSRIGTGVGKRQTQISS